VIGAAETLRRVARRWRSQAEAWARHITVLKHMAPVLQDSAASGPRFSVWTGWIRHSTVLDLTVGSSAVRAAILRHGVVDWAAECPWGSESELIDVIARLAAELPRPSRCVTVTLERSLVQQRTIRDLPPVRGAVLPRLVAAQDRRFFRRNGRLLVTDAVWVGENGSRVARAAAVEQPLVEAIAEGARAAGMTLVDVVPADAPRTLSLLPPTERHARDRVARRRIRQLAAVTTAVWVVTAGLFAGRLTSERRRVDAELAAAQAPLAAVRAARRELAAAEAAIEAMRLAERDRGRVLATLGAIARALPDSVVLTSLVWTTDESGALGGVGQRASDALAALRRAQVVADPRLDGRVVRETVGGREWERFTIIYGRRDGGRGTGDGP